MSCGFGLYFYEYAPFCNTQCAVMTFTILDPGAYSFMVCGGHMSIS